MSDNTHAPRPKPEELCEFKNSHERAVVSHAAVSIGLSIGATGAASDRNTSGGARRDRTDDLLLAKQALSQLSYGPKEARLEARGLEGLDWWAWEDLNFRPHAYQARALTN